MRSAIVGCGNIAAVHAASLARMEGCVPAGFADIKRERAEKFARQYGGNAYTSLEEMLEKEKPDVLHICTPHYLHVPMAVYGLTHGTHVFMEKPPVISEEQFEELEAAAKNSDKRLGICFQNRYNPCVLLTRRLLETQAGRILGARGLVTWSRDEAYYTESGWRGALATEGGGVLINQSVHTLDLLVYLLGKPLWTDAGMSNHHLKGVVEVEDTMEAMIGFGDKNACFYATTAYCADMPPIIEISCENMTIRMEDPAVTIRYADGRVETPLLEAEAPMGKSCWGSGHAGCIAKFYHAVETGGRFEEDWDGVRDTARLMLAVYQSARKGIPVEVATLQKARRPERISRMGGAARPLHGGEMNEKILKNCQISCFADEIGESVDKQIALLKELGITWVEFRSGDGKSIADYTLEEAAALKKKLDENGIGVSAVGSPIGKIGIEDDFAPHFEKFKHIAELAEILGTRYIRMFSFFIPQDKEPSAFREEVLKRLRCLKEYAAEKDLVLLHENEKGIYGDNAQRCLDLMQELYDDHFKCTFDFANFVQCKQETLPAYDLLKPYISYVHVKDALFESGEVVPGGEGDGQLAAIFEKLDQAGFEGFLSLEPHLTDFAGLKGLEQNAAKRGRSDQEAAFCQAYEALRRLLSLPFGEM